MWWPEVLCATGVALTVAACVIPFLWPVPEGRPAGRLYRALLGLLLLILLVFEVWWVSCWRMVGAGFPWALLWPALLFLPVALGCALVAWWKWGIATVGAQSSTDALRKVARRLRIGLVAGWLLAALGVWIGGVLVLLAQKCLANTLTAELQKVRRAPDGSLEVQVFVKGETKTGRVRIAIAGLQDTLRGNSWAVDHSCEGPVDAKSGGSRRVRIIPVDSSRAGSSSLPKTLWLRLEVSLTGFPVVDGPFQDCFIEIPPVSSVP